jgi:UDP-N-acetylglucosamine 1-carboxyvinyltransferase
MSKYIIDGGQPLKGEVSIRGAKNAAFKEIIASLLSAKPTILTNIPQISDVRITESIAKSLGSQITYIGEHSLQICTPLIKNTTIPQGTGDKSRTSFIFTGPLLARKGKITFPLPGGDRLGERPLDRLFDCLKLMNVKIAISGSRVRLSTDKLVGTNYTFPKSSHTSTEVIIMVACLAHGDTIINNAAQEPEIDDLISMLNSMGASISRDVQNPTIIRIHGVSRLAGTRHQVICDRNEAVTFACASLATKGRINILRIIPKTISAFLKTIQKMGARVIIGDDEVGIEWVCPLKSVSVTTEPEPGFMTDWQAIFSVVLSQAVGSSTIIERVFPSRFQHIAILNLMGAKTQFFNPKVKSPADYYFFNQESDRPDFFHGVKIFGPTKLKPSSIEVNDLRAGACATLAALTAPGRSVINHVELINRGYEQLGERLVSLGAHIQYIKT